VGHDACIEHWICHRSLRSYRISGSLFSGVSPSSRSP
jgi:hypothetical protein